MNINKKLGKLAIATALLGFIIMPFSIASAKAVHHQRHLVKCLIKGTTVMTSKKACLKQGGILETK